MPLEAMDIVPVCIRTLILPGGGSRCPSLGRGKAKDVAASVQIRTLRLAGGGSWPGATLLEAGAVAARVGTPVVARR